MAEIVPGVWLPQATSSASVGEEDDHCCDEVCEADKARLLKAMSGPGAAVVTRAAAAVVAEEAEAVPAASEPSACEKAFKNYPDAAEDYRTSEWNEVPDVKPFATAWYNCVKRYRFVRVGNGSLGGGPRLIIEVVLMSGTMLRRIIKLRQVKGILTKGRTRDTQGYVAIEEVIVDMRPIGYEYNPDQLKFRFTGAYNALAFHMALEAAM